VRADAIGVYGLGFIYVALSALAVGPVRSLRLFGLLGLAAAAIAMYFPTYPPAPPVDKASLHVAGLQTEEWQPAAVAEALDHLATAHPEAQLLVLSEEAFYSPVPQVVRDVIKNHQRYLIAGGRKYISQHEFYNTAFVVGPDGSDVFSQVKSVPVQFMDDCIPASERHVWDSPWGKIGIAICYDAGFARVMDELVAQGACGLIVPTMDATYWGEFERRMLHGRVAPIRAAEYGIPVFGVWSSGISQLVDASGRVVETAGYPGQGETILGDLDLSRPGHIPPDRPLAIVSTCITAMLIAYLAAAKIWSIIAK
jgi:apolipoprotein N-acyltransferase